MDKLLYQIGEASEVSGLGRTKLYQLMNEGQIASVKVGKRRLIPAAALERFVAGLVNTTPAGAVTMDLGPAAEARRKLFDHGERLRAAGGRRPCQECGSLAHDDCGPWYPWTEDDPPVRRAPVAAVLPIVPREILDGVELVGILIRADETLALIGLGASRPLVVEVDE